MYMGKCATVRWACSAFLQHLPLLPGSRWLWGNCGNLQGWYLASHPCEERALKEGLVPLLPERWVLCPRYRITSLFNKTKYKLHQPLWKVKAFFSCCLQDINKNRLIKSKAAQLDRASRKKNVCCTIFQFPWQFSR